MTEKIKYMFMSKEKKRMHAKLAMRRSIRDLDRWDRNLEKKKAEMIKLGREANRQGIKDQYVLAFNGLKMVMNQQLRARKMQLQLKLVESMRDLSHISSDFLGMMGKIGKEVEKVAGGANFLENQAAFESGMFSLEQMMDQMDGFMSEADSTLSDQDRQDTVTDDEIARLFDIPQETAVNPEAADPRIAELSKQLQNMLGEDKAEG